MSVTPSSLERVGDSQLAIEWTDGMRRLYGVRELRDACPCATCREKRKQPSPMLPVLTDAEAAPLRIDGMKPVGNYAYAIIFSDGHDSGIFTFELLRKTGSEQ